MSKTEWTQSEKFQAMVDANACLDMFIYFTKLGKYENITTLTTRELIEQLNLRAIILDMIDKPNPALDYYFEQWVKMFSSDTIIIHEPNVNKVMLDVGSMFSEDDVSQRDWLAWSILPDECTEFLPNKVPKKLSSGSSIQPLSVEWINYMSAISDKNNYQGSDDFSAHYIFHPITENFPEKYKEAAGQVIALNINLADYTDDEILDDLRILLQCWRQETNIESKPAPSKASCTNLKKIINNKYILLLDGMIFNRTNSNVISDEQLITQRYPHLDIQPDSFRKTYKRNARAFGSVQCYTAWMKTLTNLGMSDRSVQEVMQINF